MGNIIFSKYWDIQEFENINIVSTLPGKKIGMNGSCLGGYNISVNKYISDDNKVAAVEVLKFFTSKKIQKDIIIKNFKYYSALTELYNDEEVCSIVNCEFIKNVQSVNRPSLLFDDYSNYSLKIITIFKEFLDGKKSAISVLTEINDITRVYYLSLKSTYGLIIFISIIFVITFSILLFLFIMIIQIKKKNNIFSFFDEDLLTVNFIGILLILFSEFFMFGELSDNKCQIYISMFFIGITFNFVPILYILFSNYIKKVEVYDVTIFNNDFSQWTINHKFLFIILNIGIDCLINSLFFIFPQSIGRSDYEKNGIKTYNICAIESVYGYVIILFQTIMKIAMIFIILYLLFKEWNIKKIYNEIRAILYTIYIDTLLLILLIIISFIRIANYEIYFFLHSSIMILFSLSNYINLYIIRIVFLNNRIEINNDNNDDSAIGYINNTCNFKSRPTNTSSTVSPSNINYDYTINSYDINSIYATNSTL